VALSDLEPAVYNPRETDPKRLDLIKLSLTKLGFVLPLYANNQGHLLSGHQRLLAASQIGLTHVPVVRIDVPDRQLKGMNLIFNRATNDMRPDDTSDSLFHKVMTGDFEERAAALPDKVLNTPDFFPAARAQLEPIPDLLKLKIQPYDAPAIGMCYKLMNSRIFMPLLVSASGEIVNGSYRLYAAADQQHQWPHDQHLKSGFFPVIRITDEEAEFAKIMVNLISMRFTLEKQYADTLRYGAYRRPLKVVEDLTPSWRIWPDGGKPMPSFKSLADPEKFWHNFRKELGDSILDYGAGQRRNEPIAAQKGIKAMSWEPYPCPQRRDQEYEELKAAGKTNVPSLALSRRLTDELLAEVARGRKFTTIGLSSVLNSVPFDMDRMYLIACVHALCSFDSQLIGAARHESSAENYKKSLNARTTSDGAKTSPYTIFSLDYEPNIVIGDIKTMPKVQRFHSVSELERMLGLFFVSVKTKVNGDALFFRCRQPRRVNPKVLKTAILHQYNLPYQDGLFEGDVPRINRGQEALAAYGQRLGIDFSKVETDNG